ncbi:hypothetical protein F5972_23540 [Microbispora cellulosiformans]|uniref:FAD-binding domain-containing protein n=1 Tax=Microbispora cellulosiformans TaxID=2614688 RepID=A0A5J5JXF3_9ACTN|nr:hypothetical protein F5972_23540 [Microbispora cellulosiformans]
MNSRRHGRGAEAGQLGQPSRRELCFVSGQVEALQVGRPETEMSGDGLVHSAEETNMRDDTPVLIVGAGLAGLSTAVFLGRAGVLPSGRRGDDRRASRHGDGEAADDHGAVPGRRRRPQRHDPRYGRHIRPRTPGVTTGAHDVPAVRGGGVAR